jgi:hypothetical protein
LALNVPITASSRKHSGAETPLFLNFTRRCILGFD